MSVTLIKCASYVQMLERQQVQLIAGLQELYNRTQTGVGWTAPPLEPVNYGQPLTHKILDGLGVLRTEEWEDGAVQNGLPRWRSFEEQIQQGSGIINDDDASTEGSPTHTAATSPVPRFQAAFPNSTIMAKRRLKHEVPTTSISQTLDMPSFKPFAYESNTELSRSKPYSQDLSGQIPLPIPTLEDNNIEMQQYSGSDNYMGDKPSPFNDNNNDNDSANLNWMSMSDDLLNLPSFQGLLLQVQ